MYALRAEVAKQKYDWGGWRERLQALLIHNSQLLDMIALY